ncbi:uncharacterized protein M421DRAFT_418921 [Didymella exigua CBS 183.55]|uniref:Concanavalin A-like lectin/glucanase n=1 Tax=Didymella exigua CBS 183.55 TaxID=1150837 RepID=A0A6A5RZE2_9PLEO|nr:uncharacterized protein M421DRAFT_418921 [Didymella exigua CBS 183.55]KAF1930627.1 hypothetical protein M421DRAFT_418921 [Didymella exigua CBS 183.55]
MFFSRLAVLSTLPFLSLGMKKRAVPSNFALYGYGDGLGGFPLFYADGFAYIGEPAKSNSSDAATVAFSLGTDDVWIGNPNNTQLTNSTAATWSNVTFYVPDTTATDKRIGFLSSNASTDGAVETGFFFYGSTAVLIGSDGTLESSWYALKVGDRTHQLYWNDTSLGQVPVILRSIAPSSPPQSG